MRNQTPGFDDLNLTDKLDVYLHTYGHITPGEYRLVFGAERLAPRIRELRQRGLPIETAQVQDFSGKTYTRYVLRYPLREV